MTARRNYEPKPLFTERMKKLLPNEKDFQSYVEISKRDIIKSIRCNTLKISPDELVKRLEEKRWKIRQPFKDYPEIMIVEGKVANKNPDNMNEKINHKRGDNHNVVGWLGDGKVNGRLSLIDLEPGELGRSLEHLLGYYYVQEIASMLPIIALNPKPGENLLDLCSSPGSKTTQASAKMKNSGLIIANELNFGRLRILAANLERCGVSNAILTKKDGSLLCEKLAKQGFQFDKILVDAPCSGEGTIRSTPKTLEMWNINSVKQLSGIQKRLVLSAFEILKDGGEMVYSTCTHSPEENEEVLDFLLNKFGKKIKIEKISLPVGCREGIYYWEGKSYNKEALNSCRIYPQDNNTEGFFLAKIKKIG